MEKKENCFFESFSPGKDDGVDLRRQQNDNTWIIQIKRAPNDFKTLLKSLKKYELPKVQKLKPNRYMIVTSATLSKTQKDQILELFSSYIKNSEDVLGEEDLNNLLNTYPEVEINYPNLWFHSGEAFFNKMHEVLNSEVLESSRYEYENIVKMMKYFVPTPDFSSLIKKVTFNRYLLITGNPGIGKTTLARAFVAYFVEKENYQLIYTRSTSIANRVFRPKEKQIFFFDDFWGSAFKENDYHFNDERELKEFIEKVANSSNKILILTSRDYVLKQGLLINTEIEETLLKEHYLLDLKESSVKVRADILLHHLYYSSLKYQYLETILDNAKKIVLHKNYNPRVIESFLKSELDLEMNTEEYLECFIDTLTSPLKFLDKIYLKQTTSAKLVLYLLLTVNGTILFDELKSLFQKCLKQAALANLHLEERNLMHIIEQLEKNFVITKYLDNYGLVVSFVNPSIKDYLLEYGDNFLEFEDVILESIQYINQVEFFMKKYLQKPLGTESNQKSAWKFLEKNFDDIRISSESFYETIPFEKISNQKLNIYKWKRTLFLPNIPDEIIEKAKNYFKILIKSLEEKSREYIYEDDLSSIIDIISEMKKYIEIDGHKMISLYYKNCIYAYELYLIKGFKEIFPKEYESFEEQYSLEIMEKLKTMACNDLNYFYQNKKYQALNELHFLLETELCDLIDDELEEKLEFLETPDSYYESQESIANWDVPNIKIKEDIKDISKYCFQFFHISINYQEANFKKQTTDILNNQEIIELKKLIKKTDYLKDFVWEKNSLDLIINFFKERKRFPTKLTEFCNQLINYMITKEGLLEEDFELVLTIAYETFFQNEKVFTIDTLKKAGMNVKSKSLQNILNSPLFIQEGKWIHFCSSLLHVYCISVSISLLRESEKEELYQDIVFACGPLNCNTFTFESEFAYFISCLKEIDFSNYSKYIFLPSIKRLLKRIDETTKESIVKSFIEFFQMSLHINNLNYKSLKTSYYSIIELPTWELLEKEIGPILIQKEITLSSFLEFKETFLNFIEKRTIDYRIELKEVAKDPRFYSWLEKYDLTEKIMLYYNKLKDYTNILQDVINKVPKEKEKLYDEIK